MAASQPASWTLEQQQRLGTTFPDVTQSSPEDVLVRDAAGASAGQAPSSFSQTALALAQYQPPTDDIPDTAPNVAPQPESQSSGFDLSHLLSDFLHAPRIPALDVANRVTNPSVLFQSVLPKVGVDTSGLPWYLRDPLNFATTPLSFMGGGGGLRGLAEALGGAAGAGLGTGAVDRALPENTNPILRFGAETAAGFAGGAVGVGATSWANAFREAAEQAAANEAMIKAAPEAFQRGRGSLTPAGELRPAAIRPEDVIPRQTVVMPSGGVNAGVSGGAEGFTQQDIDNLVSRLVREGKSPREIMADPEYQAAQKQVFARNPEPTAGEQMTQDLLRDEGALRGESRLAGMERARQQFAAQQVPSPETNRYTLEAATRDYESAQEDLVRNQRALALWDANAPDDQIAAALDMPSLPEWFDRVHIREAIRDARFDVRAAGDAIKSFGGGRPNELDITGLPAPERTSRLQQMEQTRQQFAAQQQPEQRPTDYQQYLERASALPDGTALKADVMAMIRRLREVEGNIAYAEHNGQFLPSAGKATLQRLHDGWRSQAIELRTRLDSALNAGENPRFMDQPTDVPRFPFTGQAGGAEEQPPLLGPEGLLPDESGLPKTLNVTPTASRGGGEPPSNAELAARATPSNEGEIIQRWHAGNDAILSRIGNDRSLWASVQGAVAGDLPDSYLSALLHRKANLRAALLADGVPEDVAKSAVDKAFGKELEQHYGGKVPPEARALLARTYSTAQPSPEELQGLDLLIQRWKNTTFGAGDFGVLGVQLLNAIRRGNIPLVTGMINRGLAGMNLPHIATELADSQLPKRVQLALDGVHQGIQPSGAAPEVGTVLSYLGKYGKALDRATLTKASNYLTKVQFENVLGTARDLDYDGNLVMLRLLGRDIQNPRIRAEAAANANVITSFAESALNAGRRNLEGRALISPSMTRARIRSITQMAQLLSPKASPEQRILAAMMIGSTYVVYAQLTKWLNDQIGTGDVNLDPSKPGFGVIQSKFTNDAGKHELIDVVPQDSIERAFAQSLRAMVDSKVSAEDAQRAWERVALGSGSLLTRGVAGFGFRTGYQPGKGYKYGNLPLGSAAEGLLPIPPLIGQFAEGQTSPLELGGALSGVSVYPENIKSNARPTPTRSPQPSRPSTGSGLRRY